MVVVGIDADVATISAKRPIAGASAGTGVAATDVSVKDLLRGFGVTYGPSLLLDLLVGASVAELVGEALRRRVDGRLSRLFRPVAGATVALTAVYLLFLRRDLRRWGATDEEVHRTLPGDELVPDPGISATWAVTVQAPVHDVWSWLAQIGQDRGGFYSYEWMENLAGCKMRNADRIHPEWQERAIGETVHLHPLVGLPVARFEPDHALVLDGWGAFVVEPMGRRQTRLISRSRVPRGWMALSHALLLEIPHFVMQRKMLLGIKARAEQQQDS